MSLVGRQYEADKIRLSKFQFTRYNKQRLYKAKINKSTYYNIDKATYKNNVLRLRQTFQQVVFSTLILDALLADISSDNELVQCQSPFCTNESKNPKIFEPIHVLFDRSYD